MPKSFNVLFSNYLYIFFCTAAHGSALWVQVCLVQSYCTGGDHHKAQTGGGDLVLIKAFPWDYNVEVGRNLGAPL